jgi:hypothetical protein
MMYRNGIRQVICGQSISSTANAKPRDSQHLRRVEIFASHDISIFFPSKTSVHPYILYSTAHKLQPGAYGSITYKAFITSRTRTTASRPVCTATGDMILPGFLCDSVTNHTFECIWRTTRGHLALTLAYGEIAALWAAWKYLVV